MTTSEHGVDVTTTGDVLEIVIDRPDRKGSLTMAGVREMVAALEDVSLSDTYRAVLLRSVGDDFCTGSDWVATNAAGDDAPKPRAGSLQRRLPVQAHRLIAVMLETQLPIVCAVRGWAAGMGCQIALAADFTVAAANSRFWLPFTKRGFTPDSGSTWLLPRLIGVARAKQMLMLGRDVDGATAAEWGMVHAAVPAGEVEATARALVDELAAGPTVALGLTKRCVHTALDGGIVDAMADEAMAVELSSRTNDFREGLAAFTARRDPDFQGR